MAFYLKDCARHPSDMAVQSHLPRIRFGHHVRVIKKKAKKNIAFRLC